MQCYFTVNWDLEVLLLIHLIKYMRHQKKHISDNFDKCCWFSKFFQCWNRQ